MTIIRNTRPHRDLVSFRHAVSHLFDDATFRPLARSGAAETRLPLDITSTDEAVTVEAALPGVHPDNVEITVHENSLTIGVKDEGQHEAKEGERVYRELRRSSGTRTLTLPNGLDTDNAVASFDNGLLRLSIPRAEAAKPRHIAVTQVTEAPVAVAAESKVAEDETGSDAADQA